MKKLTKKLGISRLSVDMSVRYRNRAAKITSMYAAIIKLSNENVILVVALNGRKSTRRIHGTWI